jgi:phage shock protein A
MDFLKIIKEGRVEDFQNSFSQKFSKEQLERIIKLFLPKYLSWVGKNLDAIGFDEKISKLSNAVKRFDSISSNLPITDLYQYKSDDQLYSALDEYENKQRRVVRQVEGGNVVFEDDKFFVVNPLNHKTSCYYGKGTKWCTSAEENNQFNRYNEDGKLFYIIDKRLKTDDPYYKVALLNKFEGDKSWWDAKDNSFTKGWIFADEDYKTIMSAIEQYMESQFAEQLKIYRDKEAVRKEKDRLSRIREQQRIQGLSDDAEERRANGEWDLTNDPDDEALKAHALFNWLVDNNEIEPLTNEDKIEIQRIKDEIERLQTEYDNSEEVRTDLLDEIEDLEDTLDEYDSKIDVYNIIPNGKYYDMTQFEVINAGLEGRGYAVGDASEMDDSANQYVENLIDDIGYAGFSSSFARSYIDEDAVVSYAEDVYYEDVQNNPDVYFDDSERELSGKQEEKIEILKMRKSQTQQIISELEDTKDGENEENDEIVDEKIEELEDLIVEYEDEIQEIEDSPEGDFPQDMVDEKVEDLVADVKNDPESFMNEFGLEWEDYIDKDAFIEGVIESDGYGIVNSYDGNYDEEYVNDILFYVMRID